jgi:hypothetical protein
VIARGLAVATCLLAAASTARADDIDASTLEGKVMCGYQGWFAAEVDGLGRGWRHWGGHDGFRPGSCSVDLWPDMSELGPGERYATRFRFADGRTAEVYSAQNRPTVVRHFRWMKDYGIDGVFLQRFVTEISREKGRQQFDTVLDHAREGARLHGRAYAIMYDLSGLPSGGVARVAADWRTLCADRKITADSAYLRHRGKPVVAVWGVGFNDGRRYTLAECLALVRVLRREATVLLGVPSGWRTLDRDAVRDPQLHEAILAADIVSPWTVGRYRTLPDVETHAQTRWAADLAWCRGRGKDYLPVVFPGFSWHNMKPEAPLDQIPRQGGRFLWKQYVGAKRAGATMVYQAMFDEMDEGTAIFKCANVVPVGPTRFVTYEGLPSDHYLWLVGEAARMIRGERPVADDLPVRRPR